SSVILLPRSLFSTCASPSFLFFNDTAPTEIYTLSLHDALPICPNAAAAPGARATSTPGADDGNEGPSASSGAPAPTTTAPRFPRSEEHTSELQSRENLVCRLLLEKKKRKKQRDTPRMSIQHEPY